MKIEKQDLGPSPVMQHQYARAKEVCKHFRICQSTLWNWTKTRTNFPQPLKVGRRVTLFDVVAIDSYLKSYSAAKPNREILIAIGEALAQYDV